MLGSPTAGGHQYQSLQLACSLLQHPHSPPPPPPPPPPPACHCMTADVENSMSDNQLTITPPPIAPILPSHASACLSAGLMWALPYLRSVFRGASVLLGGWPLWQARARPFAHTRGALPGGVASRPDGPARGVRRVAHCVHSAAAGEPGHGGQCELS